MRRPWSGRVEMAFYMKMIDLEEELKKFHPSLEVEDAEDAITNQDLTDMADVLIGMIREAKDEE